MPEPDPSEPDDNNQPEPSDKPSDEGGETPKPPARLPDDHPLVKAYHATRNELADAKGKVREYEDADKSEHEKLTERNSELTAKLTEVEKAAVRYEVALEKGLTKSQARRLVGSTREELEADADELLEDLGGASQPSISRKPQERLKPGGAPEAEPEEEDPAKLADMVTKAKFG